MLRITSEKNPDSIRLIVEGSLTGPWISELAHEWSTIQSAGAIPLIVDLTGVTFIAEDGKALLSRMWREGAELLATGCCNSPIVEHITGSRLRHSSKQRTRRT